MKYTMKEYLKEARKKMEQAKSPEEKQLVFEAMGRDIIDKRIQEQSDAINGMMQLEFVKADYEEQSIIVRCPIKPWQLNSYKTLHGGISATAVDTIGGMLTQMVALNSMTPTVCLNVNYLTGVQLGENLMVKATIQRAGRSLVYVQLDGWVEASKQMVVGGMATYMLRG